MRTKTRADLRPAAALLALVALALLPASGRSPAASHAAVCSYPSLETIAREFLPEQLPRSQLIFVGTVVEEQPFARTGPTTYYQSTVRPDAWLKGGPSEEPITIPWLEVVRGDCKGGPRMHVGERLLLGIYWSYMGQSPEGEPEYAWQLTNSIAGKIRLEDGQAISEGEGDRTVLLGGITSVVRDFGLAAGASNAQIETAIKAANAPMTPEEPPPFSAQEGAGESSDSTSPWPFVIVGAVVAAIGVAAAGRMRQSRTRPRERGL